MGLVIDGYAIFCAKPVRDLARTANCIAFPSLDRNRRSLPKTPTEQRAPTGDVIQLSPPCQTAKSQNPHNERSDHTQLEIVQC